jgi:hypothetical protein
MGNISRTTLATSSPLNLTQGFGFFPANTTIDNPSPPTIIGIGAAPSLSQTLIDETVPLGLFRFRLSVGSQMIAGAFFGYNLGYDVQGFTTNTGDAFLEFFNDSSQGGAGFGFGFTLSFSFRLDRSEITGFDFAGGFRSTWLRVLSTSATATIDLIAITLRILRASGINVPLDQISTAGSLGASGAIWGLFSSVSDEFRTRGSLTLRPQINVSGNILSLIPQLRAPLKALKKAGGKLKVGPQLNIIFPVTIEIVRLTTEDGDYDFDRFNAPTFRFNGGPNGATTPTIQDFSIVHSHSIGLLFTLEIKASFSMWGMFSLSASLPVDLTTVLPIQPLGVSNLLGPFFTTLNSQQNMAQDDSAERALAADLPEVIWG